MVPEAITAIRHVTSLNGVIRLCLEHRNLHAFDIRDLIWVEGMGKFFEKCELMLIFCFRVGLLFRDQPTLSQNESI